MLWNASRAALRSLVATVARDPPSGHGHRRPIPDLIIAATAELHGAEVLHVDSDYDLIAEVTGQPMRRLFDPGHA